VTLLPVKIGLGIVCVRVALLLLPRASIGGQATEQRLRVYIPRSNRFAM